MSSLIELRSAARAIFDETIAAMDAGRAVRRAVRVEGSRLKIVATDFTLDERGVYAVGLGKAAGAMACALEEVLGERLKGGVLSAPVGSAKLGARWRVFAGGHPTPNEESLEAARAAFGLLDAADREAAIVVFLVSGGGSAMMEWPRDERLTLEDLRAANRVLVTCGASIAEINSVRRALSAVKGGGLSRRAGRAAQATLIVSDTRPGRPFDVASGPTYPAPADSHTTSQIIARYGLASKLPARVVRALEEAGRGAGVGDVGTTSEPSGEARSHYVLLDNARALECAARAARERGFVVEMAADLDEQDVDEGARLLAARLFELYERAGEAPVCLISGGEFSSPADGRGIGGRSAQTALRIAFEFQARMRRERGARLPESIVGLFAGTDGLDGNSPAAGAFSDHTTIERAWSQGLDAQRYLAETDAYTLLDALGDSIITGATGTNVRDVRLLLAE